MKKRLPLFVTAFCVLMSSFIYGQSDICDATSTMLVDGVLTSGTNVSATQNEDYSIELICGPTDFEAQVWYQFMATSNSAEITFTSTGIVDASVILVKACGPCSGPDDIAFYACGAANGSTQMSGVCLDVGDTYWLSVASAFGNEGTFDIEVDQSANFDATNSTCGAAMTISDGNTVVNNFCTTQNYLFFEYTVQVGPAITISTSNNSPIIPGCGGGNAQVILPDCTDPESAFPTTIPIDMCLQVGQTVIIRVDANYEYPIEIDIVDPDPGAAPPEDNDLCSTAFDFNVPQGGPLICSASSSISGNGAACPDSEGVACNDSDPGIWAMFTIDPTVPWFDITGTGFELFSGPDCTNLTSLFCAPASGIIPDFSTTYFVLVTGDGNSVFTVTIPNTNPTNDDCAATNPTLSAGSNLGLVNLCASPDVALGSCGASMSEATVWYQYTPSQNITELTIELIGVTAIPAGFVVYDACGGNILGESCTEGAITIECGIQNPVWIQVGSATLDAGDFELEITEGNPVNTNDLCADAATDAENTLIACTSSTIMGDNTDSCPEAFTLAGCNIDTEPTVWEELVLPAGTVSLEFSNISANFSVTVWDACGGSAFVPTCVMTAGSVVIPGGTTSVLISVSSPVGSEGAYSFDVLPVVPPTNDSCLFPDDPLAGTLTNACATSDLASGCTPIAIDESTVWYTYDVTSSITSITIDLTATTITGQSLNVYDAAGGCTNLVLLGQDCANGAQVIIECPPVGELLIMVGSAFADTGEFTIAITEGPASALNDLCADATDAGTLPDCMDVNIIGSTLNSCPENFTLAGCNIDVDPTTWYQFTLPANATAIEISNIALTSALDLELTLWDACPTGGTAQAPVCFNADQIFNGVTGGGTYFVSASSTTGNEGGFSFDVLAIVPPANDACADAIAPTGTLTNVCATADVAIGCAASQDESTVWYVYNIANSIDQIEITLAGTGTAITNPAFTVLDGAAGCNGALINGVSPSCAAGTITIDCPPVGDIFILVGSDFDDAGEFTLTITEGSPTPVNDLCVNATAEPALVACTPQTVMGTNLDACPEDFTLGGCNIDVDPTVWHEITVPAGTTAIELEVSSGTALLTLWDACPIGGSAIGTPCISASAVNNLPVPGAGTYFISVGSPTGNEGPYTFEVTAIVPPSNDDCANADPATAGNPTTGTNVCSTPDFEPTCTSSANSGLINTVWYEYTIPAGVKSITISVAGSGADPMTGDIHLAVVDGCTGPNLYQSNPDSETCNGSDVILTCPTPGDVIFILVGSLSDDEGEFEITITEDNPTCTYTNDECDMAEAFPVDPITNMGEECISGCNELACPDPEIDGVCGTVTNNVVWFTVTTDGFDPTIETFITASVDNAIDFVPVVGIFTGSCPPVSALTSIGCNAGANLTVSNAANAANHPMPNTTYYIAVANSDDTQSGGTFDICIEVLQGCANDDCDNPLTLSDGVTQVTTTMNCTDDYLVQACGQPTLYEATAWYSYTVPAGVTAILIEASGATGNLIFDIGLMPDCTNAMPFGTTSDWTNCNFTDQIIPCVIEGEEYTIFFGSEIGGVDFDVTITGLPPTDPLNPSPDNDLCDFLEDIMVSDMCEFVTVTMNNIDACPESISGNLSDLGTSCDFDLDPTVWFEVTLPLDATGLEFDNLSNGTYLAVFDPDCPVTTLFEDCMDQANLVPIIGLTGGNTYYIAVANPTESNAHTFDILAITQPPNDDACPTGMFPAADISGGSFTGTTCCALGANDNGADFENLTSITNCGAITQDNTVWFTYQFPGGSDAIQIDFLNSGIQGGAAIEVYVVDDINEACDGVLTVGNGDVAGWACDAVNDDPIQIGCPDPDRFYLIKLTTTDDQCGEYTMSVSTISSSCDYADVPCEATEIIQVTTPPDFSLVYSCVEGCLEFACPEDPLPPGDPCVFQDNPTVWFQASLDDIAAQMFTTVTTNGTWQPVWSVYAGDDCDNLIQLGGGMGGGPPCSNQDNTPDLQQLAVESDFTNVWIAVSADGEVDDPTFEFCIATTINAIVCLGDINDNCEPEAEFMANTEDMADDPGPFCPGEEVEICIDFFYDATESGADWLIGIVPVFGGGWDLTNFDPVGDAPGGSQWYDETGGCAPILQEPLPHMCTFTNSNGSLELCNALCDACPCTPGMEQDDPLPSGWFWVSNGGNAGCDNDCSPGEGWGIGSTTSQINFCFTLEVKEFDTEEECGTPPNNDLQISFQTFSDGVAGCWEDPVAECLIDRAQFSPAWEVDCNFSPPAEAEPVLICSGDLTDVLVTIQGGFNGVIEVEISDDTSPNILGQTEYMFTGGGGTITDELINCGTIVDTARYIAYATVDGFACPGPAFEIKIPVSPKILIDPQPNPYIVCLPHTIENLPANISGGSGSYPTVEWYWNGSGSPIGFGPVLSSYTLTVDGFIEIQVTDSDGCTETHILEVDIFEKLEPEILIDATEVCKDVAFLGASASVAQGIVDDWFWYTEDADGNLIDIFTGGNSGSNVNIDPSDSAIEPGKYTIFVEASNDVGCVGIDSVCLTIYPLPSGVIVQQPSANCDAEVELCIEFYDANGNDIYENGPDLNGNGIPDLFEDENGNADFTSITWYASFIPAGSNTNDLCFLTSTQSWYDAEIETANGCFGLISIDEIVLPTSTPPTIEPDTICLGETTTLAVMPQTYDTYEWEDADGNPIGGNMAGPMINVSPIVSSTYFLTVTDANNCTGEASVTVEVNPLPDPQFSGNLSICAGQATEITALGDPTLFDFDWLDPAGMSIGVDSFVVISSTGTYTLNVTNEFGCMKDTMFTVNTASALSINISGSNICDDDGCTTLNGGAGFDNYEWIDMVTGTVIISGPMEQTLEVCDPGDYILNAFQGVCSGSDTITIEQVDSPIIDIADGEACNITSGGTLWYVDFESLVLSSGGGTWSSLTDPAIVLSPLDSVSFAGLAQGNYEFIYTTNTAVVPCADVSDTITIVVGPCDCPNPNVNDPIDLCNGDDNYNLNTLLSMNTDPGQWVFLTGPDATSLDGDTMFVYNGVTPGVYEFAYELVPVPIGTCTDVADTIAVTVVEPPVADIEMFACVCETASTSGCNNGSTMLNLHDYVNSGTGNWVDPGITGLAWTPPMLDFSGLPLGPIVITYQTNNAVAPCENVEYTLSVDVTDCNCPNVSVGTVPDQCNDNSVVDLALIEDMNIAAGAWVEDSGNPSTGNISGSTVTLTGQPVGFYIFTYVLSSPVAGCASESVPVIISVSEPPSVTVMDYFPCNIAMGMDSTTIELNTLVSDPTIGSWTDATGAPVVNTLLDFDGMAVGTMVTYTFTTNIAVAPCTDQPYTVTLTVADCDCPSFVFAQPPIVCSDDGMVNLDVLVLPPTPAGFWTLVNQPSGSTANIVGSMLNATGTVAGIYTVAYNLSDAPQGCQSSEVLDITVSVPSTAELTTDHIICNTNTNGEDTSYDLNDAINPGGEGGVWTDENGVTITNTDIDFLGLADATYTYTYTLASDAPCEPFIGSITITAGDCSCPVVFDLQTYCSTGGTIELFDVFNIVFPGTWYFSDGTAVPNSIIDYTGFPDGVNSVYYEMDDPGTTCLAQYPVEFNIVSPTDLGLPAEPLRICEGENVVVNLLDLLPDAPAGGMWIETSVDGSMQGAFDDVAGTFTTGNEMAAVYSFQYEFQSAIPCPEVAETVQVIIEGLPVAEAGNTQTLTCDDNMAELGDDAITSQGINFTYQWIESGGATIPNNTESSIVVTESGVYTLIVTDANTGCSTEDFVTVNVDGNIPSVTATNTDISCFGAGDGSVTVTVNGGVEPIQYSIDGGGTYVNNNIFNNLGPGNFQVSVIDGNGCETGLNIEIVQPERVTVDLGNDITLSETSSDTLLTFMSNFSTDDITNVVWTDEDGIIICEGTYDECSSWMVGISSATVYCVEITTENGCVASDCIQIRAVIVEDCYVPNIFSPNGDAQNDVFFMQCDEYATSVNKFFVFDRWGEMVYGVEKVAPNDPVVGWDGTLNDKNVEQGVYAYYIEVEFNNDPDNVEIFAGDITVIR